MAVILVVDDEPSLRETVRHMLERAGHHVIEAGDGARGLARYRERKPDLVITDILMPGKDGIEALREIHRLDPAARIVVMSGGRLASNFDFLGIAERLGAAASVEKPFKASELLAVVDHVLRSRSGTSRPHATGT